jgi:hypothetical protein
LKQYIYNIKIAFSLKKKKALCVSVCMCFCHGDKYLRETILKEERCFGGHVSEVLVHDQLAKLLWGYGVSLCLGRRERQTAYLFCQGEIYASNIILQ